MLVILLTHPRKRVLGRQKKHLGDLSLLAGLPAEAWNYYQVGTLYNSRRYKCLDISCIDKNSGIIK